MSEVRHSGIVSDVSPNKLSVTIVNASACSGCHAQGSCLASDLKEKEIDIFSFRKSYAPGQRVTVILRESAGVTALFFGYLFPFILVVSTLAILFTVTGNEILSGLLALAALVPYYLILYIFRERFKKSFSFQLDES